MESMVRSYVYPCTADGLCLWLDGAFGGIKASRLVRELGPEGLSFTRSK